MLNLSVDLEVRVNGLMWVSWWLVLLWTGLVILCDWNWLLSALGIGPDKYTSEYKIKSCVIDGCITDVKYICFTECMSYKIHSLNPNISCLCRCVCNLCIFCSYNTKIYLMVLTCLIWTSCKEIVMFGRHKATIIKQKALPRKSKLADFF